MGIFKSMLNSDQTLFKNSIALDYDYIPKLIPFRENEQMEIARSIRPLFMDQNGRNLILYGTPGIGKTVAVRHVLKELEEETDDIYTIYINCWQRNTTYKIMVEICNQIGYKFITNKNSEELFGIITKIINQKAAVFVFDEIDKAQDYDFLYEILNDIYKKSIILITNFKEWTGTIDNRIKSRLVPQLMEFKSYGWKETRAILKERAELAFYPDVIEDEAFDLLAQQTFEISDIRLGLYLLREAGLFAEEDSAVKIKVNHAVKAIGKIGEFGVKNVEELDEESKELLKLINENPNSKIGELYIIHKKKGAKTGYKTFQRKIKKLNEGDFIDVKKVNGGSQGKTTIIKPKSNKRSIDESVEESIKESIKDSAKKSVENGDKFSGFSKDEKELDKISDEFKTESSNVKVIKISEFIDKVNSDENDKKDNDKKDTKNKES